MNALTTEDGQPSGSKTLFAAVVLVILARGAVSGLTFGGVSFAEIPETLDALSNLAYACGGVLGWRMYAKRKSQP